MCFRMTMLHCVSPLVHIYEIQVKVVISEVLRTTEVLNFDP